MVQPIGTRRTEKRRSDSESSESGSNKLFRLCFFTALFVLIVILVIGFVIDMIGGGFTQNPTQTMNDIVAKYLVQLIYGIFIIIIFSLLIKIVYMIAKDELNLDKLIHKGWRALIDD